MTFELMDLVIRFEVIAILTYILIRIIEGKI